MCNQSKLRNKDTYLPCGISQHTVSSDGPPHFLELITSFNAFFSSSFVLMLISVFNFSMNGHFAVATHSWFNEQVPEKQIQQSKKFC